MKQTVSSEHPAGHRWVLIGLVVVAACLAPGVLRAAEEEEVSPSDAPSRELSMPGASDPASGDPAPLPETDPARLAEAVQSGVLLVKGGQHEQAIELLEPYRDEPHFTLLHALGIAYLRSDRNRDAFQALMRAHQLRPTAAGPLLPAALACARMARVCDEYRELAMKYKALGGKFTRLADKIEQHVPYELQRRQRP